MADIHILGGDGLGNWTLVCHFPVADVNNQSNVSYRVALINSGLGGTSQMSEGTGPGQISTAELAQIQAGELYEHSVTWPAESGATTNQELIASARAMYTRDHARAVAKMQKCLRYFGWSGAAE